MLLLTIYYPKAVQGKHVPTRILQFPPPQSAGMRYAEHLPMTPFRHHVPAATASARKVLCLAVGLTLGLTSLAACAAPRKPEPALPASVPSNTSRLDELLAQLAEKSAPGESHRRLLGMVGTWDLEVESRSGPESPWQRTQGRSVCVQALGGRYVVEYWSTNLQGQPFEAMHVLGYDRLAEKFLSIWMDSFSTWPVNSSGRMSSSESVLSLTGSMRDVLAPDGRPFHLRLLFDGPDQRSMEVLDSVAGTQVPLLRVRATRRANST